MWRAVLGASLLAACSAALPPPPAARLACYAIADARAQARADAQCRIGDAGVDLSVCPWRDEILEQLQQEQEACK